MTAGQQRGKRLLDDARALVAYEKLLRTLSIDYDQVNNQDAVPPAAIAAFFAPNAFVTHAFANHGDRPARLLNIHAPSTGFHDRLREMS